MLKLSTEITYMAKYLGRVFELETIQLGTIRL